MYEPSIDVESWELESVAPKYDLMTGFVLNMEGLVLIMAGFALNMTGFVLNITGFVLNIIGKKYLVMSGLAGNGCKWLTMPGNG